MPASETVKALRQSGLTPPQTLTLAITGACNLECLHCWVDAGPSSSEAQVPVAALRRVIEEFAALGGEGIRFTGGEPLCHPDWLELMQLAKTAGLRSAFLQTNAMLLTDEDVTALRRLDFPELTIQISLDGATAPTHDRVRGEGAYQGVLDGIRRLANGGLAKNISIFFTEMRHNLQELPTLLELANRLGVGSVTSGSLVLCGRAAEDNPVAPPEIDQYMQLLNRFEADPRFRALYEKLGTVAPLEWFAKEAQRSKCCSFAENPYLTSTGKLYPCVLCHVDDFAVAGVFEKGLADAFAEGASLWSSLLQTSRQRAETIPQCQECPEAQTCNAGCMGRAWGSCGDLMAADDRCDLRRSIYQRKNLRSVA